jgi:sulfite reductase beta subunit-like hemoprotein
MVSGGKQSASGNGQLNTHNHNSKLRPFRFQLWKTTNVFAQKQAGYFAVYVRVPNGNISSHSSRRLIEKLKDVIADDVRVTINQGLQFRFIKPEHLEYVYSVWMKKVLQLQVLEVWLM